MKLSSSKQCRYLAHKKTHITKIYQYVIQTMEQKLVILDKQTEQKKYLIFLFKVGWRRVGETT